jgi:hypothetical protein
VEASASLNISLKVLRAKTQVKNQEDKVQLRLFCRTRKKTFKLRALNLKLQVLRAFHQI